ncbi:exosortase/archaeosortase family protein [Sphingomonas sp. BT-65]|uniref:exosortase/archaeosortase family protein n=1 Tax=Sphingomonas sp. BT-65 TaxID=2989821 RepID=UPI00223556A6|nr:exosortase/archaeosortase family protein [Sphingomonas sp. BT-65]MCW4463586.1 exosortase/archaeosortase family protein [Sphingomonas sp. BT-65]
MIPARTALILVGLACWDAWSLLAGRASDPAEMAMIALLAGGLAWRGWQSRDKQVPALPLAGILLCYALVSVNGPALLQIGVAAGAMLVAATAGIRLPRLPMLGLTTLLLPVLPTLDFLLAYPLRRVSALITVGLLRANGMDVGLNGVALEWQGQALLFDGPCSGVRMLWASLVLASIVALAGAQRPLAYARSLLVATAIAILGNALRAASLFYVEHGRIERLQGPVAHEAVGVIAFALVAAGLLAVLRPQWRPQ